MNLEEGIKVPVPLSIRHYSGTITLSVPPETHRALAMDAAEADVNMNRLTAERLALSHWLLGQVS